MPLLAEQEKEYLARCQMGDVEARNALIEHNLRLVAHVAKKYQSPDQETDELISIGIIGLIKAVMTFDQEKNSRLATYAARCIENELLMMLRVRKKRMREVSMYEKIGTDQEGRELRLMDVLESPPLDILEDMEREQNLRPAGTLGALAAGDRKGAWHQPLVCVADREKGSGTAAGGVSDSAAELQE